MCRNPHHGNGSPHRPLRVLIVEDCRDTAESLALLVTAWGHDAAIAHNGLTALEMAAEQPPEVVLIDVGLPHLSGWDVARSLRQPLGLTSALLVALTGYGRDCDRRHSKDAGCDHHLTKPVEPTVLEQLLRHQQRRIEGDGRLAEA